MTFCHNCVEVNFLNRGEQRHLLSDSPPISELFPAFYTRYPICIGTCPSTHANLCFVVSCFEIVLQMAARECGFENVYLSSCIETICMLLYSSDVGPFFTGFHADFFGERRYPRYSLHAKLAR